MLFWILGRLSIEIVHGPYIYTLFITNLIGIQPVSIQAKNGSTHVDYERLLRNLFMVKGGDGV